MNQDKLGASEAFTTEPVTRHTRAGRDGKLALCPCGEAARFYHFNFIAVGCSGCGEMVPKNKWRVESKNSL